VQVGAFAEYYELSPPLRGGDQGEGEAGHQWTTWVFTPTLILPPQGGGNKLRHFANGSQDGHNT